MLLAMKTSRTVPAQFPHCYTRQSGLRARQPGVRLRDTRKHRQDPRPRQRGRACPGFRQGPQLPEVLPMIPDVQTVAWLRGRGDTKHTDVQRRAVEKRTEVH